MQSYHIFMNHANFISQKLFFFYISECQTITDVGVGLFVLSLYEQGLCLEQFAHGGKTGFVVEQRESVVFFGVSDERAARSELFVRFHKVVVVLVTSKAELLAEVVPAELSLSET